MDRHRRLRESVGPLRYFKSFLWGISSGCPLASRFDLSGFVSVYGLSPDPPMCAHADICQSRWIPPEAYG